MDASGGEVLTYDITDDKIYVSVLDNDDPSEVMVRIGSPVDTVEITLDRESTGVYTGNLSIAESSEGNNSDQVLQAPRGSELEASYTDASDSFGNQKEVKDKAYFGVTLVSGVYSSDKTWRKSESPYLVTGDVEVNNGAKLTIEPGVEVRFTAPSELTSGDDRSSGEDPNRAELRFTGQSKLDAKGTAEEPIIFRSNREEAQAQAGDWWGIYAIEQSAKIQISHVRLRDAIYGLRMRNIYGSVLDTVVVEYSHFHNIQNQSLDMRDWITTHIRIDRNELDKGVELGRFYNGQNQTPLSIRITDNNFLEGRLYLRTGIDNSQNNFDVLITQNKDIGYTSVNGPRKVRSEYNNIFGTYEIHYVEKFDSYRDSLKSEGNIWTGWYSEQVARANINQTYVSGYENGIWLNRSSVVIDSSTITGNSNRGIHIYSDFDYLSRSDTLRYSTVTGNGGDGVYVEEYGRLIANYNNIYGNNGYEYRNNSNKWEEIDARHNWWGENTTAEMNEGSNPKNIDEIYDVYDDNGLGFVNYSGWLDEEFEVIIVDPKDKIYLNIDDIITHVSDTTYTSIQLSNLGNRTISSYQFAIEYDHELMDIVIVENQTGLSKDFDIFTNENTLGKIFIAGISSSGADIIFDGSLLDIIITYKKGGTSEISFSELLVNEGDPEAVGVTAQVSVTDIICGDVTNDLTISALDASYILRHSVRMSPQFPLVGRDSTAADVTANGFVSAFDAAMIIKHIVGYPITLSCRPSNASKTVIWQPTYAWTPELSKETNQLRIPISISDIRTSISAVEIQLPKSENLKLASVSNLPEGWEKLIHSTNDYTTIAAYGLNDLVDETTIVLNFDVEGSSFNTTLEANIRVNEAPNSNLEPFHIEVKPNQFTLSQNYPNPFNPTTQIEFALPEEAEVRLDIFNMLGQKVQTLKNERMAAGYYSVTFNANNFSSGVYIYQLRMGNKVITKRMLLLK